MSDTPPEDISVEQAAQHAQAIREQIARAVVGQHEVIDHVLIGLFAAGHVLVEGVPGLGKTLLVRALARTFAGTFRRIQLTPDLLPADVTGHTLYDASAGRFRIRRGPVFTNLLLADEINRAPAKTQSALLEVMQERQVTIEGQSLTLAAPFMTLATQNPVEHEGTFPLPEAQLDRFLLKILIAYPPHEDEVALVRRVTAEQIGDVLDVSAVSQVVGPDVVLAIQRAVGTLTVDQGIFDYAVRVVRATRDWPGVAIGAGPRGGIALLRAARACALLAGRDFVVPDDVKAMAVPGLRHRLVLAPELQIEGRGADAVLEAVLESVEAPRA